MADAPWFVCEDCPQESNSEKAMSEHCERTGHTYFEETH